MSQLLINDYLKQLDLIKKISGSRRETIVREAFKDLLKAWGKQQGLVFLAEYPLKTATKSNIMVDGALLHELRMALGYWEAKDESDDLAEEISKKLKKGYPQDNIIFSDDATAVLWQNRNEVLRCDMTDTHALARLLKLFFSFERPEIAGFRAAVEQFKADLPAVLQALREMIEREHKSNAKFRKAEQKFLAHAQEAINPGLTDADVREMLIQHILTEEIFAKVFDDSDFHQHNNVARELYALEGEFFTGSLKKQTLKGLETYYAAIRAAAAQISSHHEKQTFLKVIYENFYKVYNTKAADRLGVVYTPNEIVRFMIDGADWLTEKHFGKNLIDKDVEILDPATGTGTFICELLEHFRGQPAKLKYKYLNELHANEVAILPYYVANLNIESTYAAITGSYEEFPNLCFVDTLDNVGLHTAATGTTADIFGSVSEENVARIKRQNSKRIKHTYIHESTAQKTKLYDMYARFFRWASDRLSENGVLAFITNRSFIDSRTFDGFRKTVANEFSEAWIVDLGGDWKGQSDPNASGGNVFNIGTGVAVSFLVKKASQMKTKLPCRIRYVPAGRFAVSAVEKLTWLSNNSISALEFDEIRPDARGNWIKFGASGYESLLPIQAEKSHGIFEVSTLGISTNRDEWVVAESQKALSTKVRYFLENYSRHKPSAKLFDPSIKWSETLKRRLKANQFEKYDTSSIVPFSYRPFSQAALYSSTLLIDRPAHHREFFGETAIKQGQQCFVFTGPGSQKPFMVTAVDKPFDLHIVGSAAGAIGVPLLNADKGITISNITDWGLKQFRQHYETSVTPAKAGVQRRSKPLDSGLRRNDDTVKITKEAIFHYCYAVLHDPLYREKYALNLKREFPRIPFYADFWQWAAWGEALMKLHIGYESVEPFQLQRTDIPDEKARAAGLPPKAMLRADHSAGSITLDTETTLRGIPPEAWDYKLGNRCALEWVLDQYKEKKPKDPTIREKFDTYRFADYKEKVIDLLARVTTVSVETERITQAMKAAAR